MPKGRANFRGHCSLKDVELGQILSYWFNLDSLPKHIIRFEPKTSFFTPHDKGYLAYIELNIYSTFSRFNTRIASPQTCHMSPLVHIKHRSNSGHIHTLKWFYLPWMNREHQLICLYVLNMSLAKYECICHTTCTLLSWSRGMAYGVGCNQLMFEKSMMFNSFLSKTSSHQVAWSRYRQVDHLCLLLGL